MHLVMFDIDGTLVDSVGFDADLYVQAVEGVLDVKVDRNWSGYEHVSDSGILEQLLRDAFASRSPRVAGSRRLA